MRLDELIFCERSIAIQIIFRHHTGFFVTAVITMAISHCHWRGKNSRSRTNDCKFFHIFSLLV